MQLTPKQSSSNLPVPATSSLYQGVFVPIPTLPAIIVFNIPLPHNVIESDQLPIAQYHITFSFVVPVSLDLVSYHKNKEFCVFFNGVTPSLKNFQAELPNATLFDQVTLLYSA
jgi:hypothetical protein